MIHKMIYKATDDSPELLVDVYFMGLTEELDTMATCWVPSKECWLTTPIYFLTPCLKSKNILNE